MVGMPNKREKALAYLRTSSATNVGGDSPERQRRAIQGYAKNAGIEVVQEFYDVDVGGSDPIQDRAGFGAMLDRIADNGVRLILVEDATRFARSVLAQEAGIVVLQRLGVRVVTASGEDLTETEDPYRIAMRQMGGVFAELEKSRLVHKLRVARERASKAAGYRVDGRKATLIGTALAEARRLRRKNPRTGERRSLRDIAAELAAAGHVNPHTGKPYSPEAIRQALAGVREAA